MDWRIGAAVAMGVWKLLTTLSASTKIENLGRRPLLLYGVCQHPCGMKVTVHWDAGEWIDVFVVCFGAGIDIGRCACVRWCGDMDECRCPVTLRWILSGKQIPSDSIIYKFGDFKSRMCSVRYQLLYSDWIASQINGHRYPKMWGLCPDLVMRISVMRWKIGYSINSPSWSAATSTEGICIG